MFPHIAAKEGTHLTLRPYLERSAHALWDDGRLFAFGISLLATLVLYAESLASGSLSAGVIYTGDYWHVCLPVLIKTYTLFSNGVFTGIDFSTHNGASDFFLRPNVEPYHPLLVVSFLLHHFRQLYSFMQLSVWMLALHSFICCYYAMRLATRILAADKYLAAFVGLGYAFSVYMVGDFFYPPFVLVATMLPAAIYGGLKVASSPSIISAILYSLPIFVMLTSGYAALAVACITFAALFTVAYLFYIDPVKLFSLGLRQFALAMTPYAIPVAVAAPYYWEMFRYHALVPTAVQPLWLVAYATSELPRTILRLLSGYPALPGPVSELTPQWGVICLSIILLFFFGIRGPAELPERDWRLLKVSGAAYCFVLLAIFGRYTALSDLLFFTPFLGKMHIYQRYLLPIYLFFVTAVAIMLRAVTRREPGTAVKLLIAALAGLLALFSELMVTADWQQFAGEKLHVSDYFIFELLLGLIFAVSLLLPGRSFSVGVATVFIFLIPLNKMFDYTRDHSFAAERGRHLEIEAEVSDRLVRYFRSQSTKPIVKYLDITPNVREYLSKNYPWFVAEQITLGSYGGYDWHVGTRDAYMQRMQIIVPAGQQQLIMRPDWHWVARTGAEFVVYQEGHPLNDAGLPQFVDASNPSRVLHLPNGIVVAPLRFGQESGDALRAVFDNGYLRVVEPVASNLVRGAGDPGSRAVADGFHTNGASELSLDLRADRPVKVQYLFWPNERLKFYVQGTRVDATIEDGLQTVSIPSGRQHLEIHYVNWPLRVFLFFYALYALTYAAALAVPVWRVFSLWRYGSR